MPPDKDSGEVILNKSHYIIKTNLNLDDAGKFQPIVPVGANDNTAKIKSFIIFAVLRRSVKRVDGGPFPRHCTRATQLPSKKYRSVGKPLATLCPI